MPRFDNLSAEELEEKSDIDVIDDEKRAGREMDRIIGAKRNRLYYLSRLIVIAAVIGLALLVLWQ
jgi:hypothetical protein